MSISLTPAAAERVRTFMASRGKGIGLRLGVKQTGCSGYAYVVSYADEIGARDVVFEVADLKYVDGTEIDFVRQGLNEAFKFRNPNVKGECGCGESFNV
jgi:iron-sulfur cluster assembly protein